MHKTKAIITGFALQLFSGIPSFREQNLFFMAVRLQFDRNLKTGANAECFPTKPFEWTQIIWQIDV